LTIASAELQLRQSNREGPEQVPQEEWHGTS